MREIKFRGKCVPDSKFAGDWVTGGYVAPEADCKKQDEGLIIAYFGGNITCTYHVIPETIGQYTGLSDQNCKEIYEGDIVEVTSTQFETFMKKMKAVIVYDDDLCCYDFETTDRKRCMCRTIPDCHIEVIGNIHDNPELMN